MIVIVGYILAVLIGITLGLVGGGGSILTVPLLVYLFDMDPVLASSYSLFVIGVSSSIGTISYVKSGMASLKVALLFSVPSLLMVLLTRNVLLDYIPDVLIDIEGLDITDELVFGSSLIVISVLIALVAQIQAFSQKDNRLRLDMKRLAKILALVLPAVLVVYLIRYFVLPNVPNQLVVINQLVLHRSTALMIFFAIIMLFAGFTMLKKESDKVIDNDDQKYVKLFFQGVLIGCVTGLVGAGGGFLIVPALVLLARLPMKLAVGTSLLIISINSLSGFLGDINNVHIEWDFLIPFTGMTTIGILIGYTLSKYIPAYKLKSSFGTMVIAMAIIILYTELF